MAPVLQCPDCNTKHPLSTVPDHGAFPCRGCGRMLKVPDLSRPATRPPAAGNASRPVPAPVAAPAVQQPTVAAPVAEMPPRESTRAMPVMEQNATRAAPPPRRDVRASGGAATVPVGYRILLWIVAIPAAYFLVFALARAFGFFTSENLTDLFLANGTSRFWPLARLLPFVALVAAAIVHGGVYALARLRARRQSPSPVG